MAADILYGVSVSDAMIFLFFLLLHNYSFNSKQLEIEAVLDGEKIM